MTPLILRICGALMMALGAIEVYFGHLQESTNAFALAAAIYAQAAGLDR